MRNLLALGVLCISFLLSHQVSWADNYKYVRVIRLPGNKPATGAKVLLRTLDPKTGTPQEEKRVVADANGVARADLTINGPAGAVRPSGYVVIDYPGMALAFEQLDNPRSMGQLEPLELTGGYEIKGKILDPQGQPLAKAQVSLASFDFHWSSWLVNWASPRIVTPEATTTTGADGTFELRSVDIIQQTFGNGPPSVRPLLSVRATQAGRTLLGNFEPLIYRAGQATNASTPRRENVLRLFPASVVRGRVVSSLGDKPLAGAEVRLRSDPGNLGATLGAVKTDANGVFQWNEVPSFFQLFAEAKHPDFASGWIRIGEQSHRIDGTAPQSYENLTLKLRPLVTVTGRVLESATQAKPLAPITINSIYEEGYNDGRIGVGRGGVSSPMNPDGTFTMKLPVGFNHLLVRGPGYSEVRDAASMNLDLKPGQNPPLVLPVRRDNGFLVHFSTNAAKGKKDFNFDNEFDLMLRGSDGKEVTTNWGEWWYWSATKPEETLEIRVTRFVDGFPQEVVPWTKLTSHIADPMNAKNWPRQIVLPLRQTINVRGRVVDPITGAALPNMTVRLLSKPEVAVKDRAPVVSGADGSFSFEGVPLPAELLVKATPPKDAPGTEGAKVKFLPGLTRVSNGPLAAVATQADEAQQTIADVVVRPRPIHTVEFEAIDSETNQTPLIWNAVNLRFTPVPLIAAEASSKGYYDPMDRDVEVQNLLIRETGRATANLPAGEYQVSLGDPYQIEPESARLSVPMQGLGKVTLKMRRLPAVAVRLIRDDPALGTLKLRFESVPTPNGTVYDHIYTQPWPENNQVTLVYPCNSWGSKKRLVITTEDGKTELFRGEYVADPKAWPVDLHLPQKPVIETPKG